MNTIEMKVYQKQWDILHPEKNAEYARRFRQRHLTRILREHKVTCRRRTEELRDGYIRQTLSKATDIVPSTWPQELVDVKREQLKVWRLTHAKKNKLAA